ncbi:MAG: hypothetical protein NTY19_50370 [Planctomycetota bacterium]|nr:hypothetical protein [Planctomycetota bacterium]
MGEADHLDRWRGALWGMFFGDALAPPRSAPRSNCKTLDHGSAGGSTIESEQPAF